MDRFQCSAAAAGRGEPALGTASRIDRWLLVEAPGPWGPRALPQGRGLDDEILLPLQQRAKSLHARTLLIRRPGPATVAGDSRRLFVADSRPGHERLLTCVVGDAELPTLPLPFDGESGGWQPAAAFVGVCTHGTHDLCCAVRGRPVAAALMASHPDITWELSHLGGDRFAANALVLPAGHYLGQLPVGQAPAVLDALLAGERPDPYYRGRSCWTPPVQAALSLVGLELGLTQLAALHPTQVIPDGAGWSVQLVGAGGAAYQVRVEQVRGPGTSMLTCHAAGPMLVPRWTLTGLDRHEAVRVVGV